MDSFIENNWWLTYVGPIIVLLIISWGVQIFSKDKDLAYFSMTMFFFGFIPYLNIVIAAMGVIFVLVNFLIYVITLPMKLKRKGNRNER